MPAHANWTSSWLSLNRGADVYPLKRRTSARTSTSATAAPSHRTRPRTSRGPGSTVLSDPVDDVRAIRVDTPADPVPVGGPRAEEVGLGRTHHDVVDPVAAKQVQRARVSREHPARVGRARGPID